MSESITLKCFPKTKLEYIASICLESQDLSGLSTEEIFNKYFEIEEEIRSLNKDRLANKHTQRIGY